MASAAKTVEALTPMMTNDWNQRIYRLWAPIYDGTVERLFAPARARALELLALNPGERVLLLGVGTGNDLPLLPAGVTAVGVDLSRDMLARARAKLPLAGREVTLIEGDAQRPPVEDARFDAVVLTLILSVVPDGRACLAAALRALRPGGRAVVFDKFLGDHRPLRLGRRLVNLASSALGTDITRRFGELVEGLPCRVEADEPSLLGGMYRVILLRKLEAS